jgi:hypothetical protein
MLEDWVVGLRRGPPRHPLRQSEALSRPPSRPPPSAEDSPLDPPGPPSHEGSAGVGERSATCARLPRRSSCTVLTRPSPRCTGYTTLGCESRWMGYGKTERRGGLAVHDHLELGRKSRGATRVQKMSDCGRSALAVIGSCKCAGRLTPRVPPEPPSPGPGKDIIHDLPGQPFRANSHFAALLRRPDAACIDGLTFGLGRIFDGRGRSPNVLSNSRPIVRPGRPGVAPPASSLLRWRGAGGRCPK